jgi:adenylate kinase family enzyme
MTPATRTPPPATLIALIGPPISGKSTVAADLRHDPGTRMFDLEEVARDGHRDGWFPAHVLPRSDPYSDYDADHIGQFLRAAIVNGHFVAPQARVVLDGFPRSATHLRLLHRACRTSGARLAVVELVTSDLNLMTRRFQRRRCLACIPDPNDNPYQQAPHEDGLDDWCPQCGHPMMALTADEPLPFMERLERYVYRRPAIEQTARDLDVAWSSVDTTPPPSTHLPRVRASIAAFEAGRHPSQPLVVRPRGRPS